MTETLTLAQHVGLRLKALREASRVSADEVARAARASGLSTWHRSTVATLETGRRGLSADELLLLPHALALAGVELPGIPALSHLLPAPDVRVKLSEGASVTSRALHGLANGELYAMDAEFDAPFTRDTKALTRELVDATTDAARKLGIRASHIEAAAVALWGHTLIEERERRVAEHIASDANARTVQAHRGHAMRAILAEVVAYFQINAENEEASTDDA